MRNIITGFILILSITISVAQNTPCACCTEAHSEFDFWIGNWDVTLPNGAKAGENTIVKEHGGCVIKESWTSANGNFTGTSFNYYNTKTEQWEQLWLDVAGTILKLKGKRVNNQMILRSDAVLREDGTSQVQQITYTLNEDESIRQLWEVLQDEDSVSVLFDGLYKKKI
ncbi:hypothetical protein [uncultured Muriicola sp.]|uniref:hypothetical protein n=1 Tax=uncultured Muriicola sp. TaxID=1583102 RepID=UPI00262995A3|nr:hypothetical protein [uncultured Muriicola sp.]